jgi:hypothetical protein
LGRVARLLDFLPLLSDRGDSVLAERWSSSPLVARGLNSLEGRTPLSGCFLSRRGFR